MGILEIKSGNEQTTIILDKVLLFKRLYRMNEFKCCIIFLDETVVWCHEEYYDLLIAKFSTNG